MSETYETGTGQVLPVHSSNECTGACSIHKPSDHALKKAPTHWRGDRGIMERICEHGVGHPDPDDLAYRVLEGGEKLAYAGIHGCCGCCRA